MITVYEPAIQMALRNIYHPSRLCRALLVPDEGKRQWSVEGFKALQHIRKAQALQAERDNNYDRAVRGKAVR